MDVVETASQPVENAEIRRINIFTEPDIDPRTGEGRMEIHRVSAIVALGAYESVEEPVEVTDPETKETTRTTRFVGGFNQVRSGNTSAVRKEMPPKVVKAVKTLIGFLEETYEASDERISKRS